MIESEAHERLAADVKAELRMLAAAAPSSWPMRLYWGGCVALVAGLLAVAGFAA